MSHAIVAKASGVPRGRVVAVLDRSPVAVRRQMTAYRRESSSIVIRTDRQVPHPVAGPLSHGRLVSRGDLPLVVR
jgi:hypothetical protein